MNESYSIPWFYSDSWNIPRPMNPSIGPFCRGRTQFVSERWNSRKGTDHPHHQVQHSSPNASSPRVETLFLDPCCFFGEGKLIHSFWCNVFLIQASDSVNMQLGQETHIVLEDIANANKNAWFMIPNPRSITPDLAYQPQPQKPEKHVKMWRDPLRWGAKTRSCLNMNFFLTEPAFIKIGKSSW